MDLTKMKTSTEKRHNLSPEQQVKRKMLRERVIHVVACPTCHQPVGHNCIGRKNRRVLHSTRIRAYKEKCNAPQDQ